MADSQYNGETRVQVLLEYLQVTATVQISAYTLHSTSVCTAVQWVKTLLSGIVHIYLEMKKKIIVQ